MAAFPALLPLLPTSTLPYAETDPTKRPTCLKAHEESEEGGSSEKEGSEGEGRHRACPVRELSQSRELKR